MGLAEIHDIARGMCFFNEVENQTKQKQHKNSIFTYKQRLELGAFLDVMFASSTSRSLLMLAGSSLAWYTISLALFQTKVYNT